MKNRAKCKLCKSVIESFHRYDYVLCKCGEISISGGLETFECAAKNWNNFLRVDENNNEIIIKTQEKGQDVEAIKEFAKDILGDEEFIITKKDKLNELEMLITNIDSLPPNGLASPVTHYDLLSALLLISSILRDDCDDCAK